MGQMLGPDGNISCVFAKTCTYSLLPNAFLRARRWRRSIECLAEKWNPLFDSDGRKNLVEDVNALVRDFLRPIRASFQRNPPDSKRIEVLAEQLSMSGTLAEITKKGPLKRYIELYILRCLNEV